MAPGIQASHEGSVGEPSERRSLYHEEHGTRQSEVHLPDDGHRFVQGSGQVPGDVDRR